jgi:uncharacterized membrane protein
MRRKVGATLVLIVVASWARGDEPPLVCYGNEPSWSLDLSQGSARLALLGEEPVDFRGSETRLEALKERAWRGGSVTGQAGELVVFLREAACSDGMSDVKRPVTARVSVPGGLLLSGCCRPGTLRAVSPSGSGAGSGEAAALGGIPRAPLPAAAPAPPPADWAASLAEYVPALRACVNEALRTEAVHFAERRGKDVVHLVLRLPGKSYVDCEAGSSGPPKVTKRPRNQPLAAAEEAVVITLSPGEPPRGRCDRSEPALDERGNPFGWITRKGC